MTRVAIVRRAGKKNSAIEVALRRKGFDAQHVAEESPDVADADVVLAIGNINWFPRLRERFHALRGKRRPVLAVWHFEPLPFPAHSGFPQPRLTLREAVKIALRDRRATDAHTNYRRLRQLHERGLLDLCIATSRSRQNFLLEKGIPAHFVPLGYHDGMGRRLDRVRDIDVLFIGTSDDARHRAAIRAIRSAGIAVEALGSWKKGPTWGESRTELINRAKIFLNVQRHAGQYSGYRMLLGMANGSMVISEPIHDPFPYLPGIHYVEAALDEIPRAIRGYLADEQARSAIAESGHRFVTMSLTLDDSVDRITALVESTLKQRKPD